MRRTPRPGGDHSLPVPVSTSRRRVDHGEGGHLFRRTHGVPLDLEALSRPSGGPRPPNGAEHALGRSFEGLTDDAAPREILAE